MTRRSPSRAVTALGIYTCTILLGGVLPQGESIRRVARGAVGRDFIVVLPDLSVNFTLVTTPAPAFEGFNYLTRHLSSVYYVSDAELSKEEAVAACHTLGTSMLQVELASLQGGEYGIVTNALGAMGVDDLYSHGVFSEQNGKKVIIYEGLYGRQVFEVEGDPTVKIQKKRSPNEKLVTQLNRRVKRAESTSKKTVNTSPAAQPLLEPTQSKAQYVTVEDTQYPWLANWNSTAPGCADNQCSPTVCNVTTRTCVAGHSHICLLAVTQPQCQVQNGGNCTQTCDNCKIGKSECSIEQSECPGQLERDCLVLKPVCTIDTPQCTIRRPPCVSRQPACNVTNDYPPKILCPPVEIYCPPEVVTCPVPKLDCKEACVYCKDITPNCTEPKVTCTHPKVTCKAVTVNCPAILTTCPNPIVDCPPPKFYCPPPLISCKKPDNPCPITTTPDVKPCAQECKGDGCKCVRVKRQANGDFKQEPVSCDTKLKFICEGAKTKDKEQAPPPSSSLAAPTVKPGDKKKLK